MKAIIVFWLSTVYHGQAGNVKPNGWNENKKNIEAALYFARMEQRSAAQNILRTGGIELRNRRKFALLLALILLILSLSGCALKGGAESDEKEETKSNQQTNQKPPLPEKLKTNEQGIPILRVYQVDEEETAEMDLESYLRGVVAGSTVLK